ncbi:complement C1q-like protein 2 [Saccoglossus kowalevskii]
MTFTVRAEKGTCDSQCSKYSAPIQKQSAFNVGLFSHRQAEPRKSLPILYDYVYLNIGNNYNNETGEFVCEHSGIYVFNLNILKSRVCDSTTVSISKNTVSESSAYAYGNEGNFASASATTVIHLDKGDTVLTLINSSGCLFGSNVGYTNFNGFLLYPDD